jgi:hypothetical protein
MKFTEANITRALALYFDWTKRPFFANVHLFDWEMDACILTDSGYLWEVEIKCTLADWRADQHKAKWKSRHIDKVSRMYYAVPWTLLDKVPEFVPDHVGLIGLYISDCGTEVRARLHREGKSKRGYTIEPAKMQQLYRSTYYKYWNQVQPLEVKDQESCNPTSSTYSPQSESSQSLSEWSGSSPISPVAPAASASSTGATSSAPVPQSGAHSAKAGTPAGTTPTSSAPIAPTSSPATPAASPLLTNPWASTHW